MSADELTLVQWVGLTLGVFLFLEMAILRHRQRARRCTTASVVKALNFYLTHDKSREMPQCPYRGGASFEAVLKMAIAELSDEEALQ